MRLDNCFSVSWTLTVLLSTTDTIASRNTGPTCSVRNMQQDNEPSLKSSHTNGATPLGDMFGICQIKLHWKCNILNNFIIWILKINNIMCQKNEALKNINLGKFSVVFFMNVMCSNYCKFIFQMVYLKR